MNLPGKPEFTRPALYIFIALFLTMTYFMYIRDNSANVKPTVNLRALLLSAVLAAEYGGMEVVAYKDTKIVHSKGKTKEGANDSVTTADFMSHCVMTKTLHSLFPTLNVISEESSTDCDPNIRVKKSYYDEEISKLKDVFVPAQDVTIWVDPLDGTQEYTEGLMQYVTTMVCVAVKGWPMIGVIHKPFERKTFWAWSGVKYSKNLYAEKNVDSKTQIIVSRSHSGKVKELIDRSSFSDSEYEIVTAGGAGYKVLEVVDGRAHVYIHATHIKKWDICAGNAILNALSGGMIDLKGHRIYYNANHPVLENGVLAATRTEDLYLKKLISRPYDN